MNRFLSSVRRLLRPMLIPALALLTALAIGAVIMWLFGDPPLKAYKGLFEGAFGDPKAWARTIRKMSPFILAGLSVSIVFKAGLFNIGASGQFLMGTVAAVAVGINFEGLPAAYPFVIGFVGRHRRWRDLGRDPGILKVYTGAHEVIVTIMLNYIAANFVGWTVYAGGSQGQTPGPLWDRTARAISETPDVLASAQIPWLFGPPYRVHSGIILALLAAVLMAWLIYKTIIGFEIRTVGQNAKAARYAGVRVNWTIILAMVIAGGLAGLAGGIETLGLNHKFAPEFGGAVGFDGITVALLGQTNPFGVVLSAFLFAALDSGAATMQFQSGVAGDIIQVFQAVILAFVAAPMIIRQIYHIRRSPEEIDATPTISWGGQ